MPTLNGRFGSVGNLVVSGDLDHDGSNVGLYGVAPTTRPTTYTQTYSTADKTHANLTAADLTDNTGQTPDSTLENVPDAVAAAVDGTAAQLTSVNTSFAAIERNISDLGKIADALLVDLTDLKQLVNSVIDDLQALGILQ